MTWMLYTAIAIIFMLPLFFILRNLFPLGSKGEFTVALYVGIASLYMSVLVLMVGLASLYMAQASYWDAQEMARQQVETAKQQQGTLDKSRQALESVVTTMKEQQKILRASREALEKVSASTTNQLQVVLEQWRRELERPDVHAALFYPQQPAVVVMNRSKTKVARDVLYQLILYNLDRPAGETFHAVSSRAKNVNFIRPGGSYLPTKLTLVASPDPTPLKLGERLFGYLYLQCADCLAPRTYWVYLKFGQEGWYYEGRSDEYPFFQLTQRNIDAVISKFLSQRDLVKISKEFR